jgi:hypothetical protein
MNLKEFIDRDGSGSSLVAIGGHFACARGKRYGEGDRDGGGADHLGAAVGVPGKVRSEEAQTGRY